MKTLTDIANEIQAHINSCGGFISQWYVGIAKDPVDRLFIDHQVSEANDSYIARDCTTATNARTIEKYFLDKGADGGTGGGSYDTRFVYAYRKTLTTKP